MFIMACSFGIHFPLSIFVDDLCFKMTEFIPNPHEKNPILNLFLRCLQNNSYFPVFEEGSLQFTFTPWIQLSCLLFLLLI